MADKFRTQKGTVDTPSMSDGFPIVPGVTVFPQSTRAIYVGGTGNICFQTTSSSNTILTLVAVPAGTMLPIRAVSVFANSTTTQMIGLY